MDRSEDPCAFFASVRHVKRSSDQIASELWIRIQFGPIREKLNHATPAQH
jgi:hypothetical protein